MQNRDAYGEIFSAIYRTIDDPGHWRKVMELLCGVTGARKSILTLRDEKTSEFLVPERYANSPLYYQFSDEEVHVFITKYLECDPWTAIENRNRRSKPPVTAPYILSHYLPASELKSSRLWEWLSPQKIDDAVTLEIGQTDQYWAALNFYFESENFGREQELLDTLKLYLPHFELAFRLGEVYSDALRKVERTESTIEHIKVPAAVIDLDMAVIYSNSKIDQLDLLRADISGGEPLLEITNIELRSALKRELINLQRNSMSEFQLHGNEHNSAATCRVTLNAIGQRETLFGKPTQAVLLMFHSLNFESKISVKKMANSFGLTPRQTELTQYLCDGGTLSHFGPLTGKSKSVGFRHWEKLKERTGVENPSDIYVLANKFL